MKNNSRIVIIFDYDDTLICSSSLCKHGQPGFLFNDSIDNNITTELIELELQAIKVLSSSLQYGEVIIITNANNHWISFTLTTFFPLLCSFIAEKNIPFLSAHELFAFQSPNNPLLWKINCFQQILTSFHSNQTISHLISIGDGLYEKIACQTIASHYSIPWNVIQFISSPSITQLTKQLSLLLSYIQSVLHLKSNLNHFSLNGINNNHMILSYEYQMTFQSEENLLSEEVVQLVLINNQSKK